MAIKTGIGVGEAQVYDTSSIMNTYFKLVQKQQQDQAKYETQLADIITKADISGLDPRDSKYILEKYNSVKDTYRNIASIKNPTEQRLALSELKNSVNSINEYANNAKAWRKNILNIADNIDRNRDDYEDGVIDELKKLVDGSYQDALNANRAVISPFDFKRVVDYSYVPKAFDDIRKTIEEAARKPESFTVKKAKQPGYQFGEYSTTPEEFKRVFELQAVADKKLRYQLKELYKVANPNKPAPTAEELIDFARAAYEQKYGDSAYRFTTEAKKISSDGPSKTEQKEAAALSERQNIISRLNQLDRAAADDLLTILDLPYGSSARIVSGKSLKGGRTVNSLRITIPKSEYQSIIDAGIDSPFMMSPDKKQMVLDFEIGSKDFNRGLNVFMNKFSSGPNIKSAKINTGKSPRTTRDPLGLGVK